MRHSSLTDGRVRVLVYGQMQHQVDPFEVAFDPAVEAQVDAMIAWADTDKDGLISYAEYKKVIGAGCALDGGRLDNAKAEATASMPATEFRKAPWVSHHVGKPTNPPDPDTIYL